MMKVFWTTIAKEDYASLLIYIETNYSLNSAEKLFDKVEQVIETIKVFPNAFPYSNTFKGYKAVVTKQTSVIYFIGDKEIFIARIADTRMN